MAKKNSKDIVVFSSKSVGLTIAALIVIAVLYFILSDKKQIAGLELAENVLIILFSVVGSSLLTACLFEKNSKNKFIDDFLVEDLLKDKNILSREIKEKILKNIEFDIYFNGNKTKQKIFEEFRRTINLDKYGYYYDSCIYEVYCEVLSDYIEYDISREMKIKSFEKSTYEKNFCLANPRLKNLIGYEMFELKEVTIDGETLDVQNDINCSKMPSQGLIYSKNEYDTEYIFECKNPLTFKDEQHVTIQMKYKVRMPNGDNSMVYRVYRPCRYFSIRCTIDPEYKLKVHPFGMLGQGFESINLNHDNICGVNMNNWILPYDGAVVFHKLK